VNAGDESFVKDSDAVGGQEEDACEILQCADESCDKMVALDVLDLSLLHVNVGFVDKHDGAPTLCHFEPFQQIFFDLCGFHADVCARQKQQRPPYKFGNAFYAY
jgi:hypothetical protein